MTGCGWCGLSNGRPHTNTNEAETQPATSVAHGWLHSLIEPSVLFPAIALLVLAVLWSTTLNLAAREHASADRAAALLATDVANTYEAQVVRALREIDHTLRLVRFELEGHSTDAALEVLEAKGLLPPALLFTVDIVDARGDVVATNQEAGAESIMPRDFLERARNTDSLVIGSPHRDPADDEWHLHFARRFQDGDGKFAGMVSVSVHAGYFVSGYESSVLGEEGVLGLVRTDGLFLARRTGDSLYAGGEIDYDALVPDNADPDAPATVEVNSWDDTRRYTIARKLFEFPLAIVVGLSETERLAAAERLERTYMLRAGAASVLLLAVVALLGRLSWRLQQERTRVMEERIDHAHRIEYLAFHDNLTGLPNRAFFTRFLTQGMQEARRYNRSLALLFLDLDRFKTINDSLGHDAGDELLQEIGRRLQGAVRESDVVARLGGDEFVVLLPEIHSARQVSPVAEKILAAIAKPFRLVGQEFRVTVSIGITVFPGDGEDEQSLIKNADVAMYYAKEQGKNNYQFYSEELNADSLERLALESSLRGALERSEFRLYYQAKRNMNSGKVTGMEALLRWEHPEIGLILPMQFIPLAEDTGLIIPIGRWVFRTACQQNVAWQNEGFPPLSMAINLSARQFIDEHLLDDIKLALKESGMDPHLLEVEITESMVMRDMEQTIGILNDLKRMGVRVAIDDFGTGYSSLSTLKLFPLDTIKIDRSFIQDVVRSAEDKGLTEAIIAVGRSLSLTVVAEGVETIDQFDFLRTHSCDEFQGFYGNEPMPAEEFANLIRGHFAETDSDDLPR